MSTVYKFGGSKQLTKERNYVTELVKNYEFMYLVDFNWSYANLIFNVIVDEKIELTRVGAIKW